MKVAQAQRSLKDLIEMFLLKKTNKSKQIQNIFFCSDCKKRRNIRKAEENRYCYLNLKGEGRDIRYSFNGKD